MAEYRELKCPYGDDFEGGDECDRCEQYELCMETYPPVNLIEIPKNATNGDVIKVMFPLVEVKEKNNGYEVYFGIGTASQYFNYQWWNALYKESEVKE